MTVFLDRDGTLIRDWGHLGDPKKIIFLPGVMEGLHRLLRAGGALVLVTNQSAVGEGLIRMSQLHAVHDRFSEELRRHGIIFRGLYFCPHRADEGCPCRKPRPGMGVRARQELMLKGPLFMIGDKGDDVSFGRGIGARTALLPRGDGGSLLEGRERRPDFLARNFLRAAEWVVNHR